MNLSLFFTVPEETFEFIVSKKLKEHTTDRYKFSEVNNGLFEEGVAQNSQKDESFFVLSE